MQHFRTFGGRADEASERVEAARRRGPALPRTLPARSPAAVRALKFALVGVAGAVVNTAALYVLYRWARLPLPLASALAVEIAVVHNYLLNDWWTFAASGPSARRFVKFNISMLGGLAVNVLAVWSLVRVGLHFLPANALGVAAAFTVNFASSSGWVWGRGNR